MNYLEELNFIGGIGEVETLLILRKLGGICWDCENSLSNCAIISKNRTECEWFKKEKEGC